MQAGAILRLPSAPLFTASPAIQVGNFAVLRRDNLLGHAAQHRVAAVLQFDLGHVDGPGMMRDHHRGNVPATERIRALDAKITELKAAREALARLARECGGGSAGPCPIITAFADP